MDRPRPALANWIARRFPEARVVRLAGDASSRIFYRIVQAAGPPRVLMDYGAPFQGETDDIRLSRVFRAAGLPVAEILRAEPEVGCLMLEDLGDRSLEAALESEPQSADGSAPKLLERAVDLAAAIAVQGTPALARSERADGPALDETRLRFEMDFFLEHFAGTHRELRDLDPELRGELHRLADRAASAPRNVLCHRDFHGRNVMLRDDGALAMVDIQDARWGPDTYDLASILRDAYTRVDNAWLGPLIERYLERAGCVDSPEAFRERFEVVAAQRMIKALGSFGFLIEVMGMPRYLGSIPPTVERLRDLLPTLEPTRRLAEKLSVAGLLA